MKQTKQKTAFSRHHRTLHYRLGVFTWSMVFAAITIAGFLLLALNDTAYKSAYAQSAPSGKKWVQVYSDEFNSASLDTSRWSAYHNTYGDGNNEEACLTPSNIGVSGGSLKITAKREAITCPGKPQDSFSSGFISSREKNHYYPAFARYEIRAKLPHAQGLWPAFWLRHSAGSSVAEIDVMEYFHAQVPGKTSQTLHFPNEIGSNVAKKATTFESPTGNPAWHTWTVDIIPTSEAQNAAVIKFYVDGIQTLEYAPAKSGWINNYDKQRTFDMAINLAVGGTYTGHPDDNLGYSRYLSKCLKPYNTVQPCDATGIQRAAFPMTYEIDYVRVFKLESASSQAAPSQPTTPTAPVAQGQSPNPQTSVPNSNSNSTSPQAQSSPQNVPSDTDTLPTSGPTGPGSVTNSPADQLVQNIAATSQQSNVLSAFVNVLRRTHPAVVTLIVLALLTALAAAGYFARRYMLRRLSSRRSGK